MANLPPGAIPEENVTSLPPGAIPEGAVPEEEPKSAKQSWFQKYISAPVTRGAGLALEVAGDPFIPLARLAQGEGLRSFDPRGIFGTAGAGGAAEESRENAARVVVPQSATEAGIMAGTALAGPALSALGKTAPALAQLVKNYSKLAPAVSRVAGATAGGALGGSQEDEGAKTGALKGLAAGTAGEVLPLILTKADRYVAGGAKRINDMDAERIAKVSDKIIRDKVHDSIKAFRQGGVQLEGVDLGGVTSAQGLREQAAGRTVRALGDIVEKADTVIADKIPHILVPALSDEPLAYRDAMKQLSELGNRAFSKNPLDRTVQGVDQRDLWKLATEQVKSALRDFDPRAEAIWSATRSGYGAGRALFDNLFKKSAVYKPGGVASGVTLNVGNLQKLIASPSMQAQLEDRLGKSGFKKLAAAILRVKPDEVAAKLGSQDVTRSMNPVSRLGSLEILGGMGGLLGSTLGAPLLGYAAPAALAPALVPNLLNRYVGKVPVAALRTLPYTKGLLTPEVQQIIQRWLAIKAATSPDIESTLLPKSLYK